jgi:thiamine-phosphate pyrophosphorylase
MAPVLCLITDRARAGSLEAVVERAADAARAGVDLVQVREPDLEGGPLLDLTARVVAAVRGSRTRVLVNDRLDVALAAAAHGVHLRADSMPAARVRTIAPRGFLVGRSVHGLAEAAAAAAGGGLDYLIFGTVFPTGSKPGRQAAGPGTLQAVAASTTLPVLAVGGIAPERLDELAGTGASGLAAIGFFAQAGPGAMRGFVEAARRAFSPGGASRPRP